MDIQKLQALAVIQEAGSFSRAARYGCIGKRTPHAHKGSDHQRVCTARRQCTGAPLVCGAVFYCRAAHSRGNELRHRSGF